MVKLILTNSAPPGQESQKCLENSATDLVTPRKTRAFVTSRQSKNLGVGHLAQREKNYDIGHLAQIEPNARGDQCHSFFSRREVTKTEVFLLARGDEVRPRGDESSSFARGDQVRGTIFETFLALLFRRSRVKGR